MAKIIDPTGLDKRLVLYDNQAGRTWTIPSNWTQIRIGIRFYIEPTANLGAANVLYFGICNGTSAMVRHASTNHFLGLKVDGFPVSASSGLATQHSFIRKTGVTETSLLSSTLDVHCSRANNVRRALIIEFTRTSSGVMSMQFFRPSSAPADIAQADFDALMIAAVPSRANYTWDAASTGLAVDESTYLLDSICMAWNDASSGIGVSNIAVSRLA